MADMEELNALSEKTQSLEKQIKISEFFVLQTDSIVFFFSNVF